MPGKNKIPVSYRLPEDVVERLEVERTKRDMSQSDYVEEAIREKFGRVDKEEELDPGDTKRVNRIIEMLRKSAGNEEFRNAIDANFRWLASTVGFEWEG